METERRQLELSNEQIEAIAIRAADLVWENFTREVGKVTIRSALYIIGALILAGFAWLGLTGKMR